MMENNSHTPMAAPKPVEQAQPSAPVVTQPDRPAMQQPYQPVYAQPYQPAVQQPYSPVYVQPYQPAVQQPYSPVYVQPYQTVVQQPYPPAYAQPYQTAVPQPCPPDYTQPYLPTEAYAYLTTMPPVYVPPVPQRTPEQKLRREANVQGGALLVYSGIMNIAVMAVMLAVAILLSMRYPNPGEAQTQMMSEAVTEASGWGYLVAIAFGMMALLIWKKPGYLRDPIWQKGRSMTFGSLCALLMLTMAPQLLGQLGQVSLDWLMKLRGIDSGAAEQLGSADATSPIMFIYIGILAPITEELLFRGVLLRAFAPYGKKLSIFISALLFGLFHGNLIQTPYALLVGFVFGYVALEYHIVWAIALHMFNNLGFALLLPRALAFLPAMVVEWIFWAIIIGFFLAAVLVLIVKHEKVIADWKQERVESWQWAAVFGSPTMIIMIVICAATIALTTMTLFQQQ